MKRTLCYILVLSFALLLVGCDEASNANVYEKSTVSSSAPSSVSVVLSTTITNSTTINATTKVKPTSTTKAKSTSSTKVKSISSTKKKVDSNTAPKITKTNCHKYFDEIVEFYSYVDEGVLWNGVSREISESGRKKLIAKFGCDESEWLIKGHGVVQLVHKVTDKRYKTIDDIKNQFVANLSESLLTEMWKLNESRYVVLDGELYWLDSQQYYLSFDIDSFDIISQSGNTVKISYDMYNVGYCGTYVLTFKYSNSKFKLCSCVEDKNLEKGQ